MGRVGTSTEQTGSPTPRFANEKEDSREDPPPRGVLFFAHAGQAHMLRFAAFETEPTNAAR